MALTFLQASSVDTITAPLTVHTFSSQNLGTATADRWILGVAVVAHSSSSAVSEFDSITVGGVTVSIARQQRANAGDSITVAVFKAHVPTGTTGDVVFNLTDTGMVRGCVVLYSHEGEPTLYDSDASTSIDPSVSIDIPAGGFALSGSGITGDVSGTTAWTNLTEDSDAVNFVNVSSASDDFASAETGRTITANGTGTNTGCGVFTSWSVPSSGAFPERSYPRGVSRGVKRGVV